MESKRCERELQAEHEAEQCRSKSSPEEDGLGTSSGLNRLEALHIQEESKAENDHYFLRSRSGSMDTAEPVRSDSSSSVRSDSSSSPSNIDKSSSSNKRKVTPKRSGKAKQIRRGSEDGSAREPTSAMASMSLESFQSLWYECKTREEFLTRVREARAKGSTETKCGTIRAQDVVLMDRLFKILEEDHNSEIVEWQDGRIQIQCKNRVVRVSCPSYQQPPVRQATPSRPVTMLSIENVEKLGSMKQSSYSTSLASTATTPTGTSEHSSSADATSAESKEDQDIQKVEQLVSMERSSDHASLASSATTPIDSLEDSSSSFETDPAELKPICQRNDPVS